MSRPFRGVDGARRREADEPAARQVVARYPGRCVDTGHPIRPGDLVTPRGALIRIAPWNRGSK